MSDKAGVCERFLKGFCPNGADCSQRHVIACPEFDRTGVCSKDTKCPFPHIVNGSHPVASVQQAEKNKKKAPAKPKRKSLGTSCEQNVKKSRVTSRYFQEEGAVTSEVKVTDPEGTPTTAVDLEDKRQRIIKKIEMAKQVWVAGMSASAPQDQDVSLNDSGPYEKIQETEAVKRPPIGTLEDFISLAGYSSGEENTKEDRLI